MGLASGQSTASPDAAIECTPRRAAIVVRCRDCTATAARGFNSPPVRPAPGRDAEKGGVSFPIERTVIAGKRPVDAALTIGRCVGSRDFENGCSLP